MSAFRPFGEVSCELEKRKFGGHYSEYFFEETPFNKPALDPDTYLIIGRRGSGKTSLGEYFGFQSHIPGATSIDVNEPGVYNAILNQMIRQLEHPSELAIPLIKDIWEFTIWQLVFQHLRGDGTVSESSLSLKVIRDRLPLCYARFSPAFWKSMSWVKRWT